MFEQFHFLQPFWFLALLPLLGVYWLAIQSNTDSKAWKKIIDAKLLPLLLQGEDKNTYKLPKFLLLVIWIITVIALADPVWEKIPRPIFQTNAARVLVLDLSNSMLIDDLKPNRLARARFKIEDILSRKEEGQTGLVLFAGEAFTASPLTRDTETIRSILKVLNPQIMPVQGSRADLGLAKAHELLKQAGITKGQVLLIADGVSQKSMSLKAARELLDDGHSVSVMAVGTQAGGKLNFRNKTSVVVKLDAESLSEIAKSGGGNYHLVTTNNKDLERLLNPVIDNSSLENVADNNEHDADLQNREWLSTGPMLVLILLPFAALAFRRGWLLNVMLAFLMVGFLSQPTEVIASENESPINQQSQWQGLLDRLTKNKAQRANSALLQQQYEKARDLSVDSLTQGSAEYKLEDYEAALNSFREAQGADARYNEGNALAKLKKYQEAIAAYDEALDLNPSMQDAVDNKKAIEDFLKQQQQSGKNSQSSNENQQGNSDSQNDKQNQQSNDSKQNQDKQNGSQSAAKEGEQQQGDKQDKQNQDQTKDQENQFSEANEDMDKNKKEAEEEALEAAKTQAENSDKNDVKNKDKNSKGDKSEALGNQSNDEETDDLVKNSEKMDSSTETKELAEELTKEEKMAAEQWLRRIPDDPGGLLRRKFRYQYNQNRRNNVAKEQPW